MLCRGENHAFKKRNVLAVPAEITLFKIKTKTPTNLTKKLQILNEINQLKPKIGINECIKNKTKYMNILNFYKL